MLILGGTAWLGRAIAREPKDLTEYADAKVAAERATADRLAERLLVMRPGLIVGFLALAGEVTGFDGEAVEVSDEWLLQNDVHYWARPRSLPPWLPASDAAFAQRSFGCGRGGLP